jgi:hypothetical protein
MNFKQRLLRYMIGLSIGILISLFMFKDKLNLFTSWLPANVVKTRLQDSYWDVSPTSACFLECLEMDLTEFKTYLRSGDVDFKGSVTQGETKEYQFIFSDSELIRSARFAVRDSSAEILNIVPIKKCDCP